MKSRRPKTQKNLGLNIVRSIVLIDGEPVRRKASDTYDALMKEIADLKKAIAAFHSSDRPKYDQWISSKLKKTLLEHDRLAAEASEKYAVLAELEMIMLRYGVGEGEAWKRLQQRKASERPPEKKTEQSDDPETERIRATFEKMFGFSPDLKSKNRPVLTHDREQQLKSAYRSIVRRLHPDSREVHTAAMDDLWLEAQEAYQCGDIKRLKDMINLCDIESSLRRNEASVSMLQRITRHFEIIRDRLLDEVSTAKGDPAWNFSTIRKPKELKERLALEKKRLEQATERYRNDIEDHERSLERFKRAAAPIPTGFRRNPSRVQPPTKPEPEPRKTKRPFQRKK